MEHQEAYGGHTSDPTFMPNEAKRQQYIQDDFGKIYAGTPGAEKGRLWSFGQFQSTILPLEHWDIHTCLCWSERR